MTPTTFTPEYFNTIGQGHLPAHLGIVVTRVAAGELEAEFEITQHLLAPNGYLHAGSIVTLADSAAGYGCLSNLPPAASNFTTLELKSNHLGTARSGVVSCIARLQHGGRTTQAWDVTVRTKANAQTVALFRCTQMILYPR